MTAFKCVFLLLGFVCLQATSHGQTRQRFFDKVDSLKSVLLRADTLSPFDETVDNVYDTIHAVNEEISKRLADILTDETTLAINLDSLMEVLSLGKVHSEDKRLWIFNWDENTGGSWKSNISLVHYRTQGKNLKADFSAFSGDGEETEPTSHQNGFCSNGAWFEKIYNLKSPGRDLYLCLGSGISCNTCVYQVATVVELTKDNINFNYPAFTDKSEQDNSPGSENQTCFTLESRMGSIEKFEFDPKTQTLILVYMTDDRTPVQSDRKKRIARRFVFDGVKFVAKGSK